MSRSKIASNTGVFSSAILVGILWLFTGCKDASEPKDVSVSAFLEFLDHGGSPYQPVSVTGGSDLVFISGANGWMEVLQKISESGHSLNYTNQTGETPLLAAATSGNVEIIKLLVLNSNDVNFKTEGGETPLLRVALHGDRPRDVEVARELIRSGADVNMLPPDEFTPLCAAYRAGYAEMIILLLESGADINALEPTTGRPLRMETSNLPYDARTAVSNWFMRHEVTGE